MSEDDLTYDGDDVGAPEEIHEAVKIAPVDVPEEIEEKIAREREDEDESLDE